MCMGCFSILSQQKMFSSFLKFTVEEVKNGIFPPRVIFIPFISANLGIAFKGSHLRF